VFRKSFIAHKEYIDDNPVKEGLAARAQYYPYFPAYLCKKKKASGPLCRSAALREGPAAARSCSFAALNGMSKLMP